MVSDKIHSLKNHIYPTIPKSIMKIFRLRSPKFLKRDCAFRKSMKSHLNYKKKNYFQLKLFFHPKISLLPIQFIIQNLSTNIKFLVPKKAYLFMKKNFVFLY